MINVLHILFGIVYIGFLFGVASVSFFFAEGIFSYKLSMLRNYKNGDFSLLHLDDVPVVKEAIRKAKIEDKLYIGISFILFFIGLTSLFGIFKHFY
jgi:hypothetical protein